jgi:type II secretory pathway pseudopilin PulG
LSRSRSKRGYTIAEVLTVSVIMGMVSSFVVLIIAPLFNASNAETAKVDTIQAAAKAFYRMQRDLHGSTATGVYVCTYPAPSTCSAPSTTGLTDARVIAIITPRKGGNGQVMFDPTGAPQYRGYQVYWLTPDASGTATLSYAFNDPTAGSIVPGTQTADAAVNNALAGPPTFLAQSISDLQLGNFSSTSRTIGLKMLAKSVEGSSQNETSFESDTATRN